MSALLQLQDVHFSYGVGTPLRRDVLRGVSLDVASGEQVALMGRTGAGKTTLLQHLVGLLRPTEGRVLFDGQALDETVARRGVGMLFQFAEQQLFEDTVAEDVAFGPKALGCSPAETERRVQQALQRVGLGQYGMRSPFTLSGGEMRRVALAGVLALEPRVLVLDEPTVGLDAAAKSALLDVLRSLREAGGTLLVASHDVELVVALAQRVVVLDGGRVAADGPLADVLCGDSEPPPGVARPELNRIARILATAGLQVDRQAADASLLAKEVLSRAMKSRLL